jgi:sarcosine oxidase
VRSCEIAIVGLGLMGSSALRSLATRGADVLGFDPLRVGEPRGSSHGSCRVYRRFNFESEAYTELSERAFEGWRGLEAATGRSILKPCAVLEAGAKDSKLVAASRAAAARRGPIEGPASGAEANAAYPAFNLPADWSVVVQQSGGILLAEEAIRAFRQGLEDRIVHARGRIIPTAVGIQVSTPHEDVMAKQVILAAGPWISELLPEIRPHLRITRQAVGWFKPSCPAAVRYGVFPIFILDNGERGLIYGFPDFESRGVKAAQHDLGPDARPDDWDPPPTLEELSVVRTTLERLVPGAAGPIADREVCLYTNTLAADVIADDGNEFIVDRLPADTRIIVASPCSGHGAKFATAIGSMLADLALDPKASTSPAFGIVRFSAFARREPRAAG